MSIIVLPFTFSVGAVIIASQHNSNFSTIYSDYNGNIQNVNVASNAGIVYSKLSLSNSIQSTDILSSTVFAAANIPNFQPIVLSVHNTSTQSIAATSFVQRTFTTVDKDSGSYWASNTYTPLIAGWYLVMYMEGMITFTTTLKWGACIYKNGSLYAQAYDEFTSGGQTTNPYTLTAVAMVQMNGTTDNIQFFDHNADSNTYTAAGTGYSFASIVRVF